jgi:hypothetical protein
MANCIWRGGVAREVIWPAVGRVKTNWLGWPKLARLRRLKITQPIKAATDELLKIMLSSIPPLSVLEESDGEAQGPKVRWIETAAARSFNDQDHSIADEHRGGG